MVSIIDLIGISHAPSDGCVVFLAIVVSWCGPTVIS